MRSGASEISALRCSEVYFGFRRRRRSLRGGSRVSCCLPSFSLVWSVGRKGRKIGRQVDLVCAACAYLVRRVELGKWTEHGDTAAMLGRGAG